MTPPPPPPLPAQSRSLNLTPPATSHNPPGTLTIPLPARTSTHTPQIPTTPALPSAAAPPEDYGTLRAQVLLATLSLARSEHLAKTPPFTPNPPLPLPTLPTATPTPIPGGISLSPSERSALREQIAAFALSLPPQSRSLFFSGHRLSPSEFAHLSSSLTPLQITQRGLKIAGPPPSGPVPPSLTDLATLMDSWFFLDPLLTEVCCDMALLHGPRLLWPP